MRQSLKYRVEYLLSKSLAFFGKIIPHPLALLMGKGIGDLFYFVIGIRKRVALENMNRAFQSKRTEQEIRHILRNHYQHMGKVLMEFACIPKLNRENIAETVAIHNAEILTDANARGHGAIVLSAHFGNWEYLAMSLANLPTPFYAVFMEQKNLAVDQIIKEYRMKTGLRPLKVGGAARGVIMALREGSNVLTLLDQDGGWDGKFVKFFGAPASTSTGPISIALRYKAPILLAMSAREKDNRIHIYLEKILEIGALPDSDESVEWVLHQYHAKLEHYIDRYPEQWFWMHRRWKTPPPESRHARTRE
ncbi:MAG: lysophospholipid acyltransferase family protein [Candidatus Zhuqueibacterota bacterium]